MSETIEGEIIESTALATVQPQAPALFNTDDPNQVLEVASKRAKALMKVVNDQHLFAVISGKKHLTVEAWQTLAVLSGVTPFTEWCRPVEGGWEARVTVRNRAGMDIGAAEAQCTREERTWSKRDDYGLRSMAQCVPIRAEILTRNGFRKCDEVSLGEDVLAYDCATDSCRWVPLLDVSIFENEPTTRLQSRSLDVACTSEHTWAIRRYRTVKRLPFQHLVKSNELPTFAKAFTNALVIAAPAPGGDSPLTPKEAALLGWIITDGCIRQPKYGRSRVHIDQSKQKYVAEIRELIGAGATESVTQQPPRTFPTGRTYATLPAHRFALFAETTHSLFEKAGITGRADCPALATRLSAEARWAMLDAMLKADGHQLKSGAERTGRTWRFGQKDANVLSTFQILATLEGLALGKPDYDPDGFVRQILRSNRHIQLRALRISQGEIQPVWCPTTSLGTWVMRIDGQVLITGNTRATSKAIRSVLAFIAVLAGFEPTPSDEMPNQDDSAVAGKAPPSDSTPVDDPNTTRKMTGEPGDGDGRIELADRAKINGLVADQILAPFEIAEVVGEVLRDGRCSIPDIQTKDEGRRVYKALKEAKVRAATEVPIS